MEKNTATAIIIVLIIAFIVCLAMAIYYAEKDAQNSRVCNKPDSQISCEKYKGWPYVVGCFVSFVLVFVAGHFYPSKPFDMTKLKLSPD